MRIYNDISEFGPVKNAVVTIGTFDGVHIGHQKIISRLQEVARQTGGESVILTFFPHPRMIIDPQNADLKMLTTIAEKSELLEQAGIDHLIVTPFTRDFSNMLPGEYVKNILIDKIGVKHLVIGYDHRFGKDRKGSITDLLEYGKTYGFDVEQIPEQDIHDIAVSSTKIRNALLNADVKTAAEFLGYPYHLTGKVIKGDQIGRKLGFPTANLHVPETYKLIPADGIYAVTVKIKAPGAAGFDNEDIKGMGYIGHRPTINGMTRNIEVNLFEFNRDIYGHDIRIYFHQFIRSDMRFNNLDELREQLKRDMDVSLKLLAHV
ncbi:bifunctional riboflavin kinase/FAD synthetase [Pedobacter sp. BS3]|uniref:bifunctional riboflavin kinase/FAD synthetase n=1 Tax=Pedobacter sp. BS3 TaxID=2567937 RepID=UPI0011F09016|nr:bifunctional riboflavin kinase/FAD synthetase [Pedobacter sp. BS3]TZF82772.1 bifunctional riboflavin kinase/FAD synthetase [Pedobacter sp. BS3]